MQYGLIGSTEWAEDFPEWISDNVVTYINLGQDARPFFNSTSLLTSAVVIQTCPAPVPGGLPADPRPSRI